MKKIYLGDSRVNLVAERGEIVDVRTGHTFTDIVVSEEIVHYYHDEVDEEVRNAVASKLADINAYDQSDAVNGFVYNGQTMWIDKATRVGLVNAVDSAMLLGQERITFGISGVSVTLQCQAAKEMLAQLELYALSCYNTTLGHKTHVENLTDVAEIEGYDITAGYPDKLEF